MDVNEIKVFDDLTAELGEYISLIETFGNAKETGRDLNSLNALLEKASTILQANNPINKQQLRFGKIKIMINLINELFDAEARDSIYEAISLSEQVQIRLCSECGNLMVSGYCINGGEEYYCSDSCLYKNMTEEEYQELVESPSSDTYETDWE